MNNEDAKKNVEESIQIICKTALTVFSLHDKEEYGRDLTERLEQTAEALQKTFGLEAAVMEEYRQIVRLARKVGLAPTGSFNTEDVKNAKEIVYALCDKLDDPKEIMQYIRTVDEMMNVWEL